MRYPFQLFCVCCLLILSATMVNARTWQVPSEVSTIQAAIDSAAFADTVLVADGIYQGEGNRDLDFLGKAVTVRSVNGDPATCIIDCAADVSDQHRGFYFHSGEGADARLEGFTITNGYVENLSDPWPEGIGGGICVIGQSSPTLTDLVLLNNTSMSGGGLFVHDNSAPIISCCRFEDNSAWWGSGGGLSISNWSGTLYDCVFIDNSANQAGGGMASANCDLILEGCEFYDNVIAYYGGGFECGGGSCELTGCTFAGNSAAYGGGVCVWSGSTATLRHCTFAENDSNQGAGIYCEGNGSATVLNTIIAFGIGGAAVKCDPTSEIQTNCCDFFGNAGGDWTGCVADQVDRPGNMAENPSFCGDADTETPYSLDSGSPCAPNNYPCSLVGAWPVGCEDTGVETTPESPVEFVLHPVYPNPFNPRTTIRYELMIGGQVTLTIMDLAGKRVRTLVEAVWNVPGNHEICWDGCDERGRHVPSGAYFYRLETGSRSESCRMLLLR